MTRLAPFLPFALLGCVAQEGFADTEAAKADRQTPPLHHPVEVATSASHGDDVLPRGRIVLSLNDHHPEPAVNYGGVIVSAPESLEAYTVQVGTLHHCDDHSIYEQRGYNSTPNKFLGAVGAGLAEDFDVKSGRALVSIDNGIQIQQTPDSKVRYEVASANGLEFVWPNFKGKPHGDSRSIDDTLRLGPSQVAIDSTGAGRSFIATYLPDGEQGPLLSDVRAADSPFWLGRLSYPNAKLVPLEALLVSGLPDLPDLPELIAYDPALKQLVGIKNAPALTGDAYTPMWTIAAPNQPALVVSGDGQRLFALSQTGELSVHLASSGAQQGRTITVQVPNYARHHALALDASSNVLFVGLEQTIEARSLDDLNHVQAIYTLKPAPTDVRGDEDASEQMQPFAWSVGAIYLTPDNSLYALAVTEETSVEAICYAQNARRTTQGRYGALYRFERPVVTDEPPAP